MKTGLLRLVMLYCSLGTASLERIFFPGSSFPKLQRGVVEIDGYYADTSKVPVLVANDIAHPEEERTGFPDTQSRRLSQSVPDTSSSSESDDVESRFLIPSVTYDNGVVASLSPLLSPFRVTDSVTVTNVQPPMCVACKCLQGAQTCAAAGGVTLVTFALTPASTLSALPTNALACNPAVGGTAAATITCLITPPATLSVCDSSCVDAPQTSTCRTMPSASSCAPVSPVPSVCNTDCRNLTVGATVRCNSAYPNIISARPTTLCTSTIRKRESSDYPVIDSSFESEPQTRTGRFFGFQVYKTTLTRISVVPGAVTVSYVPSASCLPNNLLNAPNC